MSRTFTFVKDNIAIGSIHAAKGLERIKQNGVTAVLNVAIDWDVSYFSKLQSKGKFDVEYHKVGLYDNDKNNEAMLMAAVFVLEQLIDRGHTVLLHCKVGASRSVTVCALYFMRKYSISFDEALEKVKKYRPQARPVPGIRKLAHRLMESDLFCQG